MNMACTLFGLTPEEALAGMTINAARALGLAHSVGTIAAGKQADLCVWDVESLSELGYWIGLPDLIAASSEASMLSVAATLVALICWAGLAIQFSATYAGQHDVGATLWILLRFFTVLTNLAVALTMSAVAIGRKVSPIPAGGLTLAILLVGIVYMTLLRGLVELSGGALLADMLLHKVSPVAMSLWWLFFAPRARTRSRRSCPVGALSTGVLRLCSRPRSFRRTLSLSLHGRREARLDADGNQRRRHRDGLHPRRLAARLDRQLASSWVGAIQPLERPSHDRHSTR